MTEHRLGGAPFRTLGDFVRTRQDALVNEWMMRVRVLSPARELSRPVLIDHLPQLLTRIADMVESAHIGAQAALAESPKLHALDRLARGFDLKDVIQEYSLLRQCILAQWERDVGSTITVAELRRLDSALDRTITESTVSFARARERMLRALDRLSEAALGTADLDSFLHRILQATLEITEAVDTAAVLLRDGDILRLRAAVGLEEGIDRDFSLKIGEGIAGKIAAEAQPVLLRHAAAHPLVKSQAIRDNGVRALYGVPLIHAGSVVGVAYMGSRTAFEFSEEDRLLFRTTASRATSVIIQAHLVTDLEQAIAHRDRLLAQLADERARLEQILDQIPAGVVIAEPPTANITFTNRRCQEILGRSPIRSSSPAARAGWQPYHLDGRAYDQEETPRVRALRGELVVDECKIQRPDGDWVMIRANAAPVRDQEGRIQNAVVAFEDISAQKRTEETLRFLLEVSRQLAESIDYQKTLAQIAELAVPALADGFTLELLRDGELGSVVIAHADPTKAELVKQLRGRFPANPDAIRGLAKVVRDGRPELYDDIPDELLKTVAENDEHLKLMRQLDMKSAIVVPLNCRRRTIGAISFFSSASGRRYDHRDLEVAQGLADRAAMALENARLYAEAERAIQVREEVLAVVSHDLGNPLAAINMSAVMLLKKFASDARSRKQVEVIQRSASRMEHLISDLLDLASIQAGRLAVEREPQEIASIIAEAIEGAKPLARANGQILSSKLSVGSARCSVDKQRILQLFSNLLGNAKKFCPSGATIMVSATVTGNDVECSVCDTGPGIQEKDLPHIFDPYWSAKSAKKAAGLGLYIAKGIVEAHGGRIWAENQPGAGAIFRFTLPLA